ncbi:MAG TPA: endonuclease/exonuclease/phosphatase family protein [Pyrinomonadaceae bacterium]|nr:endonuclease/exonuclease/phosphatase family protein [Pyrinomonadaceae bacterium]
MSFKLLSYNIRKGGGGREALLAEVIRGCAPDLVLLQEAVRPDVVERLAAETGLQHWAALRGHSLAFLSRAPVVRREWHPLVRPGRGFLEVALSGAECTLFGVHLSAVHSSWTERRRVREINLLLEGVARRRDGFHLLAGDFNTLAPGELLETRRLPPRLRPLVWLSGGRVRYRTIQVMLDAGYADGYRRLHPSEPGYTFPTWDPHVRLDFVFLPAGGADRLKECRVVADGPAVAAASDHFPLLARVDLEAASPASQNEQGQGR